MGFIKICLVDWILFSGIEGFIFCLFFEKIGKCKKFKWWQWLILSVGNCLISKIFPQGIIQIFIIFYMFVIICVINGINIKWLGISLLSYILLFLTEIPYNILIEKIFNFDIILSLKDFNIFIKIIPIKIIQILIIIIYNEKRRCIK